MLQAYTIKILNDCQEYIPRLAQLWYEEISQRWVSDASIEKAKQKLFTHLNSDSMPMAFVAIHDNAFKQLGIRHITITCDVDNTRSKKIPERLGYTLEGLLKANRKKLLTNEISDTLIYSRYALNELPNLTVEWGK